MANLVPQYEDLRCHVLGEDTGSSGNLGAALFMHKGMSAWMRAWSDCAQTSERVVMKGPLSDEPVPRHLQPEVVMILAGMALNSYQEVA